MLESKPPVPRILSRGEALPPLKNSKDVAPEESISDEVFKPEKSSEAITSESSDSKDNISTTGANEPKSDPPSSENKKGNIKEEKSVPVEVSSKKSSTEQSTSVSDVPSKAEEPIVETNDEKSTDAKVKAETPHPDPAPASQTIENMSKEAKASEEGSVVETKALSGGDSVVKENIDRSKAPAPEVKSQTDESKPDVVQVSKMTSFFTKLSNNV